MAYNVTLIRGDGTGPELVEATRRVLEATGVQFSWDVVEAGVDVMETAGTPLPPNVLESIRKNKVALKGPITTPIGTGFRSVNVALRKEPDLYACIRPCKLYEVFGRARQGRPGHCARKHRGPVRRCRIPGRQPRGGPDHRHGRRQDPPGCGDFDQADLAHRHASNRQVSL